MPLIEGDDVLHGLSPESVDAVELHDAAARSIRARRDAAPSHAAKQTAAMLHMHRTIGTAARRRRVPRTQWPKAVETSYGAALTGIVHRMREVVKPLLEALPSLLASAATARGDAITAQRFDWDLDGESLNEFRQVCGFTVVVENPVGSVRHWVQPDGTAGSTIMKYDYGFIDGVLGNDGEDVDVYIAPAAPADADPESWVFVIHQMRPSSDSTEISTEDIWTEYDEDKIMLGWAREEDARNAYLSQYNDPRFYGGMDSYPLVDFVLALDAHEGGIIARRMDAGEGMRARALVEGAKQRLQDMIHPSQIETLAQKFAAQTSSANSAQLKRQARAALGIDIATVDKRVPALIEHYVAENVSLIESLGNNSMDEVSKMVTRALTSGTRHEELADDIEDRFGISERHARLIARDQIGKLNGQLNAARHQELGIESFIWDTAGDERVRPEHEALQGQEFTYEDPPSEGLPGTPISCRCGATPVFTAILDEADDLADDADDAGEAA